MSTQSTWWPLSADPANSGSPEDSHVKSSESLQPPAQERNKSQSYWSWSAASASELRKNIDNVSPSVDPDPHSEEPITWWSSMMGAPANPATKSQDMRNDPGAASGANEPDTGNDNTQQPSQGWFSWSLFSNPQPVDSESDTEDKRDIETFREAKSVVESAKDSCHYAVFKSHRPNDVYLSVNGTSTERSPVKFNEKKQPIMPHQLFEKAISDPKTSKSAEIQSGDQARKYSQNKSANEPNIDGGSVSKRPTSSPGLPAGEPSKILQNGTSRPEFSNDTNSTTSRGSNRSVKSDSVHTDDGIPSVSPNLESNFRVITLSTKIRIWGEALLHKEPQSEKHIYRSTRPSVDRKRRRFSRRVLVISVHSFLPTKFVRSVISQSTGSASLFAENAVRAVQRWAFNGGMHDLQVQSIALDGIGTLAARTEKSLGLLENWASEIHASDFIFVVSNSSASPVAIQILQQMLDTPEFGVGYKRIGFLSMSGALHGPVIGLDTRIVRRAYSYSDYDIIKEMFELQKSSSELSKKLIDSIDDLCQMNVKMALVGSVDDQFIPVFSSVGQQASHPNIFKCLYVDEHVDVPGFVTRLISIILTMENIGHANHHPLLRDLSELTQGTTACASHGDIFKCPDVYDLGMKFALETTSLKQRKDAVFNQLTARFGESERNLYHLPWNVRGLINDLLQVKHIRSAKLLKDLVSDYRTWDPTIRPWREIKQCFAAFEETNRDDLML